MKSLRLSTVAILGLAPILIAGPSSGMSVSIASVTSSGSSTSTLAFGDTLTVELVAHNETHVPLYGLGLIAYGYDADSNGVSDDGLRVTGVSSVSTIFNTARLETGEAIGGLENAEGPDFQEIWWANSGNGNGNVPLGRYAQIFNGISLRPVGSGDGSLDTGLDDRAISDGGVHFRIAFQVTSLLDPAVLTLNFGTGPTSGSRNFGQGYLVNQNGQYVGLPGQDASLTVAILADPNAIPPSAGGPGEGSGLGTGTGAGTGTSSGSGSGSGTGSVFGSTGADASYPPVPEPGTAALIGLGLGVLGATAPRRAQR